MTFWDQITYAAEKAVKILSRLMTNVGGPAEGKRRVLMYVTNSVMLYGCEIWTDALRQKRYGRNVVTVQRRGALRISSAYRTVSEAGRPCDFGGNPIDLLALERKRVYDGNST
ncbi:uncharacterized protein LOC124370649, partial [Homalodisca vitripennis]|uniref:uncharacterized protein LOC124370649 n=1 Tax=Homalodisca vitripennis TaxID=197043 RepID=UPI001EEA977F